MSGKFIPAEEVVRDQLDWGGLAWCCRPADTGAKDLVVMEVTLAPGGGHAFHKHPGHHAADAAAARKSRRRMITSRA